MSCNVAEIWRRALAIPLDEVDPGASKDIADGRPVIVVDDADRENEGDIIFAARKATPELLAFMIRYSSGLICVPMRGEDLDRLQLPLMTSAEPGAPCAPRSRSRVDAASASPPASPPPTGPAR